MSSQSWAKPSPPDLEDLLSRYSRALNKRAEYWESKHGPGESRALGIRSCIHLLESMLQDLRAQS